jgi:hypothetical protein
MRGAVESRVASCITTCTLKCRLRSERASRLFKDGTNVTEVERKKGGEKSAVIVERLVRVQLRAMSCERFELGIRRDAGEMILREGRDAIEIEEAIKWLRHENAKGAHIYVRPAGLHALASSTTLVRKLSSG